MQDNISFVSKASAAGVEIDRWNGSHSRSSKTFERILRESVKSTYPDDVQALTVWPTWDLSAVGDQLNMRPDELLADLGCGAGGPGLWIAHQLKVRYVGIDPSDVALKKARALENPLLPADRFEFRLGHFLELPLNDNEVDAAVSLDAILFATDFLAALTEIRRTLRIGGRFAFTSPESKPEAAGNVALPSSWEHLLGNAGFQVISKLETPDWVDRISKGWGALENYREDLQRELGDEAANILEMGKRLQQIGQFVNHYLFVAEAV